ncbi:hypothetical protein R6Q59_021316 [Mikania micrantha]|uniref:Uncharacterized protein n=1 Tax=Mikania micrantha TaxID=192012 RepID=A0A5N6PNT0_9ASTR|nr:hypothetical protein E3N88_05666 [Mikania micrantha]KAD6794807.1 hypothetical protein E3N88_05703 [Mikania micrantha]
MEIVEDDVFFADLSKRISLLIMDDDDEDHATLHCPPVSFQVISQTIHPIHNQIPSFQDQNGRREIKGTGVFIPRSSTNPRRSRQSRSKTSNTGIQTQRHVDTSSGHFHHEPYYNQSTTNTSYNSLNQKRCY